MRRSATIAITALLAFSAYADEEPTAQQPALTNAWYDVLPSVCEKFADISAGLTEGGDDDFGAIGGGEIARESNDWVEFFRDMGVEWPPGSSIKYIPAIGKLYVRNTPENLRIFNRIMATLNVVPSQIEIEVQFVEFNLTDIEALAKQGAVNKADLKKLWEQGKARLLHAPKVVTHAGEEATVKSVSECIYPTEFDVAPIITTNVAGHVAVSGVVAEPGSFETREVGPIMSVLPDVCPDDNIINVCLTPEIVGEPLWKDYGFQYTDLSGNERRVPMEQPLFYSHMVATSISVEPSHVILLGGGLTCRDRKNIVYAFISTRLLDLEGKPLPLPEKSNLLNEQQESANGMLTLTLDISMPLQYRIEDIAEHLNDSDDQPVDTESQGKKFFLEMGIEWPEGSSIRLLPAIGKLMVTNTRENLNILRKILAELDQIVTQVEIEVQFVEFETTDIDHAAAQGTVVDCALLENLWQKDKAKLLCAPKVVTQAGEEATVKGVAEYIYPTQFDTVASRMDDADVAVISSPAVIPQSFETREVGVIFCVLPDVSTDGSMLNLTISPEFVEDPEWKNFSADITDHLGNNQSLCMDQPFFFTYLANTSISLYSGTRILASGGMTGKDPTKTVYAFVTARLIDIKGNPLPTGN